MSSVGYKKAKFVPMSGTSGPKGNGRAAGGKRPSSPKNNVSPTKPMLRPILLLENVCCTTALTPADTPADDVEVYCCCQGASNDDRCSLPFLEVE